MHIYIFFTYIILYIFWYSIWHSFWHILWHFIWHSFPFMCHILWHSIWYTFWHPFRHSILASFQAFIPAFNLSVILLDAWRQYTARWVRQSLRDAYVGWALVRRAPSRLLRSFKKAFAFPSHDVSADIIFAAVVGTFNWFPVSSWRSRSKRREKWRMWDCICHSGKAPNQQNCMGKICF